MQSAACSLRGVRLKGGGGVDWTVLCPSLCYMMHCLRPMRCTLGIPCFVPVHYFNIGGTRMSYLKSLIVKLAMTAIYERGRGGGALGAFSTMPITFEWMLIDVGGGGGVCNTLDTNAKSLLLLLLLLLLYISLWLQT